MVEDKADWEIIGDPDVEKHMKERNGGDRMDLKKFKAACKDFGGNVEEVEPKEKVVCRVEESKLWVKPGYAKTRNTQEGSIKSMGVIKEPTGVRFEPDKIFMGADVLKVSNEEGDSVSLIREL